MGMGTSEVPLTTEPSSTTMMYSDSTQISVEESNGGETVQIILPMGWNPEDLILDAEDKVVPTTTTTTSTEKETTTTVPETTTTTVLPTTTTTEEKVETTTTAKLETTIKPEEVEAETTTLAAT